MKRWGLCIIAFPLLGCGSREILLKEEDKFEGLPILSHALVSKTLITSGEQNRILQAIKLKPGTRYSQQAVDQDIQSAYSSGLVDDIKIYAEPDGNGVKIITHVAPRPRFYLSDSAFNFSK